MKRNWAEKSAFSSSLSSDRISLLIMEQRKCTLFHLYAAINLRNSEGQRKKKPSCRVKCAPTQDVWRIFPIGFLSLWLLKIGPEKREKERRKGSLYFRLSCVWHKNPFAERDMSRDVENGRRSRMPVSALRWHRETVCKLDQTLPMLETWVKKCSYILQAGRIKTGFTLWIY